jgi:hypothetical protein
MSFSSIADLWLLYHSAQPRNGVDREGEDLEAVATAKPDKAAAMKFLKRKGALPRWPSGAPSQFKWLESGRFAPCAEDLPLL